jgi:hypothetical protein
MNSRLIDKAVLLASITIPRVAALQPKNIKIDNPAQTIPAPIKAKPAGTFAPIERAKPLAIPAKAPPTSEPNAAQS